MAMLVLRTVVTKTLERQGADDLEHKVITHSVDGLEFARPGVLLSNTAYSLPLLRATFLSVKFQQRVRLIR